jgi:hypothetical protein
VIWPCGATVMPRVRDRSWRDGMERADRRGATRWLTGRPKSCALPASAPTAGAGADALAAAGVSNQEIAQSLFMTLRTAELHLSGACSKLEIRSRHERATVSAKDFGRCLGFTRRFARFAGD